LQILAVAAAATRRRNCPHVVGPGIQRARAIFVAAAIAGCDQSADGSRGGRDAGPTAMARARRTV